MDKVRPRKFYDLGEESESLGGWPRVPGDPPLRGGQGKDGIGITGKHA